MRAAAAPALRAAEDAGEHALPVLSRLLHTKELPFTSLVHAAVVVSRWRTHRATALHTWGCKQEERPALQT